MGFNFIDIVLYTCAVKEKKDVNSKNTHHRGIV